MASTSISGQLADFVAQLQYRDLPEDVCRHARHLLTDALGCALVGSTTVEGERLRRSVRALGGGTGDTAIWGTAERAPLPLAVLANSAAVHAREIDDFSLAYHAGSVVVPAAVCTAAAVGASGSELLSAIAAGYEVSFRIAAGGAPKDVPGFLPFKKVGWHSTSLFGPFGAAAAAGKLLGLDTERLKWTLGLAGSSAGNAQRSAVPRALIARLAKLKLVVQMGSLKDHLDLAACSDQGVVVSAEPSGIPYSTAELTWALILASVRRLPFEVRSRSTDRTHGARHSAAGSIHARTAQGR